MHKVIRTVCLLALLSITPAYAMSQIRTHISDAQKVGRGRLTVMFWDVYDATLYAKDGVWQEGQPFALELSYLRHLEGGEIADRSIEEIREQGFSDEIKLAAWHTQMRKIFPDVNAGETLTGVRTESGEAVFYHGEAEIGRIKDPDFSTAFFDIWLSDKTNKPDLRRKLLGAL